MQIIGYTSVTDIRVKFLDEYGYETTTTIGNFKIGQVRNPYDKTTYGVGYMGVGKYKCDPSDFGFFMYCVWRRMLCRCYNEKDREYNKTYEDCTVCEEWHNYQNFAKWYEENYYDVKNGECMQLDKDILIRDNKLYSPYTCLIVPKRINMMFMTKARENDADLPNAICRCVKGFKAAYNGKSLGVFKTLEEAINAHDTEKRIHIKQVAEEFRGRIQPKLYDAMLRW